MNKRMIIKLNVFFIILLILSALISSSAVGITYAADGSNAFDKTDVMADLQSSTVNGKPFKLSDYPYNENGSVQLLNFVEYCYAVRANARDNFGLYLYIYNPIASNIATGAGSNKVQLAVKYDESGNAVDYEKFDLKFCSKSTGDYANLFYKFRIVDHQSADGKTIAQRVNSTERRYDVSGIEIISYGQSAPDDVEVGRTYKYTGYAKSYGLDTEAESNLNCTVDFLETIALDVQHTNYKTGYSGYEWVGVQKDIHSAYFSVDNELIKKYGELVAIKLEYWKYLTSIMLVIDEQQLFNNLKRVSGAVVAKYTSFTDAGRVKSELESKGYRNLPPVTDVRYWTLLGGSQVPYGNNSVLAPIIFYTNGADANSYNVSENDIKSYFENYANSYANGVLVINGREFSKDLFFSPDDEAYGYDSPEINIGEEFDMTLFDFENLVGSFADSMMDLFYGVPEEGERMNIKPIEQLTSEKLNKANASNELLINGRDLSDVKSYVRTAEQSDQSVFVCRFDITDYVTAEIISVGGIIDPGGYLVSQAVYFDFDVIYLKFKNTETETIIPVVSAPIDIIGAITPPPYTSDHGVISDIRKFFESIGTFFKANKNLFIGIAVGIVLLIIFIPIVSSIIKNRKNQISIEISSPSSEGNKSKKTKRKVKK